MHHLRTRRQGCEGINIVSSTVTFNTTMRTRPVRTLGNATLDQKKKSWLESPSFPSSVEYVGEIGGSRTRTNSHVAVSDRRADSGEVECSPRRPMLARVYSVAFNAPFLFSRHCTLFADVDCLTSRKEYILRLVLLWSLVASLPALLSALTLLECCRLL